MQLTRMFRSVFAIVMIATSSALFANTTGMVDGIYTEPNYPRHHLRGWTCTPGWYDSIAVHIWAVDPAGNWHKVQEAVANLNPGDSGVGQACGEDENHYGAHRFDIALDDSLPQYFGQPIYAFGISPNGESNDPLGNFGFFTFPDGIEGWVFGDKLSIRTQPGFGGSISSLTWRGKEFVNSSDHGREFQMATKLNGAGECYNPTEAGAQGDVAGTSTSDVFLYTISEPNRFFTGSHPAYWMRSWEHVVYDQNGTPNYWCTDPFPAGQPSSNPTSDVSDHTFYKFVTIGVLGMENVIKVETMVEIPYAINSAQIESFLGVLNMADFPKTLVYNYDEATMTGSASDKGTQTWFNKPVIVASNDDNFALGVYNRQLILPNNPCASCPDSKGHFGLGPTEAAGITAWGAVFDEKKTFGHSVWSYTNYLIIGNLQQVINSMTALHQTQNLP